MRASLRWSLCMVVLAFAAGFDWPRRPELRVSALTEARGAAEQQDALRLLAELGPSVDPALLEPFLQSPLAPVRREALLALDRVAPDAARLEAALSDASPEVRKAAVERLAARSVDAHATLLMQGAADADAGVRAAAVRALGASRSARALALLTSALRDPMPEVRRAAAHGLARRGEPAALDARLAALDAALPELRATILAELAPDAGERAALALQAGLADSDEEVVLAALRSYARATAPLPRAQLAALMASPSPRVASAAERLLGRAHEEARRGPHAWAWLPALEATAQRELTLQESEHALAELERLLPRGEALAADPLLEWLTHAPVALRPRIVRLIARTGGELHAELLVPLLAKTRGSTRAALLRLLARARGPVPLKPLQAGLASADEALRQAAIHALAHKLDLAAARALSRDMPALASSQWKARVRVLAEGLPRLSAPLPAALRGQLCAVLSPGADAHDREAAALALRALGHVQDDCARARVRTALASARDDRLIAALRASIADRGAAARALRRALIEQRDARVAATALVALTLAGDPLPTAWLEAHVAQEAWPLGPAVAFAIATGERARGFSGRALCRMAASPEPATRSNALVALARRPAVACSRALSLLAHSSSWPVRHAAAFRVLAVSAHDASPEAHEARERCLGSERHPLVRSACRGEPGEARPVPLARSARALVLVDGRVLISLPDAADHVGWPLVATVASVSAWFGAYVRE